MTTEANSGGSLPVPEVRLSRRAHFFMSDGSPAFVDDQHWGEPIEDFVNRMAFEVRNGGGYVSLAGVDLHVISDDPETKALIEEVLEDTES